MAATLAELRPGEHPSRIPGIRAFFEEYRAQLALHHTHEDTLFFPALEARVGADRMGLDELTHQHEALDATLQVVGDHLAAVALSPEILATHHAEVAGAFATMVEQIDAHVMLEENVVLPLVESEIPVGEYKRLEARARKATPRSRAAFLIPWIVSHATPDQQKALFRSAPPLRGVYWLNRRRYRCFDGELVCAA